MVKAKARRVEVSPWDQIDDINAGFLECMFDAIISIWPVKFICSLRRGSRSSSKNTFTYLEGADIGVCVLIESKKQLEVANDKVFPLNRRKTLVC